MQHPRVRHLPARLLVILAAVLAGCASVPVALFLWPAATQAGDLQPRLPLRAAFYYPWYPEIWDGADGAQYTVYHPALGKYDSSDPAVIGQHIADMQYGHIDAGIVSWWGQGSPTDGRLPRSWLPLPAALSAGRSTTSPKAWATHLRRRWPRTWLTSATGTATTRLTCA